MRLQPGAPKQYGGSNRTIIKQAYEMLVSERTDMDREPIGTHGHAGQSVRTGRGQPDDRETHRHPRNRRAVQGRSPRITGWTLRVAKVDLPLEFVRDLPRTEANIAAFLVDEVGKPAPMAQVQAAIKKLQTAQFIRNTEEGWKLQTRPGEELGHGTQDPLWTPNPVNGTRLPGNVLREIFGEPALKTYRYKDFRNFRIGVTPRGHDRLAMMAISPLRSASPTTTTICPSKLKEVREESRQKPTRTTSTGCFALDPDIDADGGPASCVSRKMVEKYDQMRAQNQITAEEATCLQDEKNAVLIIEPGLRDKFTEAMEKGHWHVPGCRRDACVASARAWARSSRSSTATSCPTSIRSWRWGARPLKGDEAERLPESRRPQGPATGVLCWRARAWAWSPRKARSTCPTPLPMSPRKCWTTSSAQHGYGNKETRTGKALEKRFGGIGYGWDRDMLRLVLAVLFRAGSIEVSHGGEKFDALPATHGAAPPFMNNNTFKSVAVHAGQADRPEDPDPGGRELRRPDRRNGGRGQERHRRGPEAVRRRGDEARAAHRGPGQGPPVAGPGTDSRNTGSRWQ